MFRESLKIHEGESCMDIWGIVPGRKKKTSVKALIYEHGLLIQRNFKDNISSNQREIQSFTTPP